MIKKTRRVHMVTGSLGWVAAQLESIRTLEQNLSRSIRSRTSDCEDLLRGIRELDFRVDLLDQHLDRN